MLNELELTGRARTHVVQRDDLKAAIHPDALQPFLDMKADAARAGIDIAVVSSFRDFPAQQRIWDMKYRGERVLYSADGETLDHAALAGDALIDAILCWSALPGASRHHWGSEIDVIDAAARPEGYRVQLIASEAAPGGVFHALHRWLDDHMAQYGFFRPYRTARGGVAPEPWHLSYAAVAVHAERALTPAVVAAAIEASDILGKERILERLAELHARFVVNVDPPFAGSDSAAA